MNSKLTRGCARAVVLLAALALAGSAFAQPRGLGDGSRLGGAGAAGAVGRDAASAGAGIPAADAGGAGAGGGDDKSAGDDKVDVDGGKQKAKQLADARDKALQDANNAKGDVQLQSCYQNKYNKLKPLAETANTASTNMAEKASKGNTSGAQNEYDKIINAYTSASSIMSQECVGMDDQEQDDAAAGTQSLQVSESNQMVNNGQNPADQRSTATGGQPEQTDHSKTDPLDTGLAAAGGGDDDDDDDDDDSVDFRPPGGSEQTGTGTDSDGQDMPPLPAASQTVPPKPGKTPITGSPTE